MRNDELIRELVTRLTPGQAASLRDQARMELQRIASSQPRPQPVRLVINRQKKHG